MGFFSKSERGGHQDASGKWVDQTNKSSRKGQVPPPPEKWKPSNDNTKPSAPKPHRHK